MSINFYGKKALRGDDDIVICAGDVETDGLGGELLAIQWGMFSTVQVAVGEDKLDKFFDDFLNHPYPCVWFFHFGQYDWRYFLQWFEDNDLEVQMRMRTETDIYEIRCRRKGIKEWSVMRDSYALWSHPLKKLADSFCPEIPKLKIDIEHFDPTNEEHLKYAKRDVEILLLGLPRLFDMISEHFGVNPSATAAGTAMKAWQYSLNKTQIYDAQELNEAELFIRQGYYGGIVFLTSTRSYENCETYDINSSYPAAMLEYGVPCGRPNYTTDFDIDYTGFYHVRVRCPNDIIVPILPSRNNKGSMVWRSGEFDTVVSTQELKFAVEHGYDVLDVFEGYVFENVEFPFNDFINHCREVRFQFKGLTPEFVAKLLQNSLYGKFGARRERTQLVHFDAKDIDSYSNLKPLDETGLWYTTNETDVDMRCLPQWAAYITANARLRLLKAVYAMGPENCLYGDTDSIIVTENADVNKISVGKEYGQFKLEKRWKVFRALAPKVYSGVLQDGTWKGAAKGLPRKNLTEQHWKDLLYTGHSEAQVESVASLRVAIRQGVHKAKPLIRKSSDISKSQNYNLLSNGDVRVKIAV